MGSRPSMALDTAIRTPDGPPVANGRDPRAAAGASALQTGAGAYGRTQNAGAGAADGARQPGAEEEEAQRPAVAGGLWGLARSRLTHLIALANLAGLGILSAAVLVLGETRSGLLDARVDLLRTQGGVIRQVIAVRATDRTPSLDPEKAALALSDIDVPDGLRVRLFDELGAPIPGGDTYFIRGGVVVRPLANPDLGVLERLDHGLRQWRWPWSPETQGPKTLSEEVSAVLRGAPRAQTQRFGAAGERVISVSLPIQRVQAILGVVTVEAGDVDAIIAAERRALAPFFLIAALVALGSSALLAFWIAGPARRLALAADQVRREGPRRAQIPDLSSRRDEIGDLSNALSAMTRALSQRIDAIERFAADVAHELKNPLTSIRSAVETLPVARDRGQHEQLLHVIRNDVKRIDRLITDISRASRVDAELARARSSPIDLGRFLQNLVEMYQAVRREDEPDVIFVGSEAPARLRVLAAEEPLGHVFRNLVDNARTFCAPDAAVRVGLDQDTRDGRPCVVAYVEDRGPGVPQENLERIFERFYTSRPRGAAFGSNSGLGLAIAKQIVEAHGGRIWAQNVPGRNGRVAGARFSVALPMERA